ncbi:MAG: hypothetical protein CMJ64_04470 [Planctomycetaceae bacterium]|nr:hypothetical protein [Planctomycetaceae bacterium]
MGPTLEVTEESNANLRYLRDLSVRDSRALLVDHSEKSAGLKIWNWQISQEKRIELDPAGGSPMATFAPSGRALAVVLGSDLVLYSDAGEELYRRRIGPQQMGVSGIEFSPDGRYLAIVNGNGTCYLLKSPLLRGYSGKHRMD